MHLQRILTLLLDEALDLLLPEKGAVNNLRWSITSSLTQVMWSRRWNLSKQSTKIMKYWPPEPRGPGRRFKIPTSSVAPEPEVHHCVDQIPPPVPIQSHWIHSTHAQPIHFPTEACALFFLFPGVPYAPTTSHSPRFDMLKAILRWIQIMKLPLCTRRSRFFHVLTGWFKGGSRVFVSNR